MPTKEGSEIAKENAKSNYLFNKYNEHKYQEANNNIKTMKFSILSN